MNPTSIVSSEASGPSSDADDAEKASSRLDRRREYLDPPAASHFKDARSCEIGNGRPDSTMTHLRVARRGTSPRGRRRWRCLADRPGRVVIGSADRSGLSSEYPG